MMTHKILPDKPASRQAGHPIFYVYAGNQASSANLGGSVTSIQPLRINLTSSENFTDKNKIKNNRYSTYVTH